MNRNENILNTPKNSLEPNYFNDKSILKYPEIALNTFIKT